MNGLFNQAIAADFRNNVSGEIAVCSAMNTLANQEVMYLWEFYPAASGVGSAIGVYTSNLGGYYFNPSLNGQYFASLYVR